jgi:hypothetical protein
MRSDWSRVLNALNYKGQRINFEILRQYVDNLPSNIPPPNFISDEESIPPFIPSPNFITNEENEEVNNYMEPIPQFIPPSISQSIIESNQPVNQNFIPNENMAQPQGIYGLNTDPAMEALIKLVG